MTVVLISRPQELRKRREQSGHSGHTLAEVSGVSQPRISELETGAIPIRPTTARRLADALGVEIPDITTSVDTPAEVTT